MTRQLLAGLGTAVLFGIGPSAATAQEGVAPFLSDAEVAALAGELSGATAKRTVQELTLHHRQRGSRGFAAAVEVVVERLRAYGLDDVEVLSLPADGEIFYGTQRSRPGWDAEFAELWELELDGGEWVRRRRIASYADRPVTLAQDSVSGAAVAELVDVGEGTTAADYEGKDVRGRFVLAGAQPGPVARLAVAEHGAAGIVSYAPNQHTAWWKEDETLVRWGHLGTFPPPTTFAFMVSLKQARAWQARLAAGEVVRLDGRVEAGQHPSSYDISTAAIRGAEAALADQEIVFSCHLDHQRPGANDNASGCATILEVARALAKLVEEGRLPRPRRTIRFVWPAEIEGTIALLTADTGFAERTAAVIHMDMVGGAAETTKAVFHVTRSPKSLPTFVNDVAEELARFVNQQSEDFAAGNSPRFPLADPEGGKEAWLAQVADFSAGSDHQVWAEGSFRVPAIYFNDWPDRYIHTHADSVANIDATKLLRAAFVGAASAYTLAQLNADALPALVEVLRRHALERTAQAMARANQLQRSSADDAANHLRFQLDYERRIFDSLARFTEPSPELRRSQAAFLASLATMAGAPGAEHIATANRGERIYRRRPSPKGPLSGFGYSYFEDKLGSEGIERPRLLDRQALWGGGSNLAYEALNLIDGERSEARIGADLSAIFGPVPQAEVAEYLRVLERIGLIDSGSAMPGGPQKGATQ